MDFILLQPKIQWALLNLSSSQSTLSFFLRMKMLKMPKNDKSHLFAQIFWLKRLPWSLKILIDSNFCWIFWAQKDARNDIIWVSNFPSFPTYIFLCAICLKPVLCVQWVTALVRGGKYFHTIVGYSLNGIGLYLKVIQNISCVENIKIKLHCVDVANTHPNRPAEPILEGKSSSRRTERAHA